MWVSYFLRDIGVYLYQPPVPQFSFVTILVPYTWQLIQYLMHAQNTEIYYHLVREGCCQLSHRNILPFCHREGCCRLSHHSVCLININSHTSLPSRFPKLHLIDCVTSLECTHHCPPAWQGVIRKTPSLIVSTIKWATTWHLRYNRLWVNRGRSTC